MTQPAEPFEYVHSIEVRYMDIDTQHIVNNGVYAHYLTEARVGYLEEVTDRVAEHIDDIVVAHLEIDYRRPVERGDELRVHVRCTDVNESSFALAYELRVDTDPVATANSVSVTIDPETGDSRPITDRLRETLR